MEDDTLMREIRAAKEAYASSLGFDLDAIVADLRAKAAAGNRPVVTLSPRRPDGWVASPPPVGPGAATDPVPAGS